MKRKLLSGACLLVAVLFFAASAPASSVTSLYAFGSSNLLSDQSYEMLINNAGGATTVDVGDVLMGVFRVDQLVNANQLTAYNYGADWSNEVTAIFAVQVLTKTGSGPYTWTFGPVASFEGTYGAGAMVAVFEDPANNFNVNTTAQGFATATDGSPYWVLGFGPNNPAQGWTATAGTDDIALLSTTPGATNSGVVNFALDVISYGVGPQLGRTTPAFTLLGNVDVNGNGNFVAPTVPPTANQFPVWDDVNATFSPVPEPASLALLGLGLVGLAAAARRRMK